MTEYKTLHDWHYAIPKSSQAFCDKCGRWETAYTTSMSCEELKSASRRISEILAKELEVTNAR